MYKHYKHIVAFTKRLIRIGLTLLIIVVDKTLAFTPLARLVSSNKVSRLRNITVVLSLLATTVSVLAAIFGLLANLLNFTHQLLLLLKALGVIGVMLLL